MEARRESCAEFGSLKKEKKKEKEKSETQTRPYLYMYPFIYRHTPLHNLLAPVL